MVVNSRSRTRAEPVAAAITARGGRAIAVAADVCDSAQVAALARAAVDE